MKQLEKKWINGQSSKLKVTDEIMKSPASDSPSDGRTNANLTKPTIIWTVQLDRNGF